MPEQSMRKPNLFVIGAMKSGTTTLHEYLNTHPDIFMCPRKEPAYFVEEYGWTNGVEWYLGLFSGVSTEMYIGESTTDYTKLPRFAGVPRRVHDFNLDSRFIYLLRDPAERAISHYWWRVQFHEEKRSLASAIMEDPYYRAVSNYPMQLKAWLEFFELDRIYISTFERLIGNPQQVLTEMFAWLGVSIDHALPSTGIRRMETPLQIDQVRGSGIVNRLRYTRLWSGIGPLVPQSLRRLAKHAAVSTIKPAETAKQEALLWLRERQRPEIRELSAITGLSFPEWETDQPAESIGTKAS